ncbi:MAG TPA: zinc-binding dehydrogenase [Aestuariivirgaceae bacterium]|nr:zinc-binding dehydrogenase [Aestuariivirgaceae bacterium]
MRAIVAERPGGPEVLVERDLPEPLAGPDEIVIDVAFAAANWSDIQKREGVYPDQVSYPAVIGLEVSGFVAEVGPGVRRLKPGARVAAITAPSMLGGYGERCKAGSRFVFPLPESMNLETGAAFPVVSLTAYHLLNTAYSLRKGEVVLVHAIGGAVGLMLTQMAVAKGAQVIGTVGSAAKARRALAFGASLVVDRVRDDFVAAALAFTGGRGVDLVIDSLGGDVLPRSFDALRPYGRVINIGEAAGYPDFAIRPKLYERSTSLAGFEVLHAASDLPRWRRGIRTVVDDTASGRLQIPIEDVFPFDQVRAMHRKLASRAVSGKLLLAVQG